MRPWATLLISVVLESTTACRSSADDDTFARRFIANVNVGDCAGAAQRQPDSEISRKPWPEFAAAYAQHFPQGGPDTVQLLEWESGRDDQGKYRKLTYTLKGAVKEARAEVWLVTQNGHTYVNTLRMTGPTDLP